MSHPDSHSRAPDLAALLERLEREHFPGHALRQVRPGTVEARFHESRLGSDFQPVVRAHDASTAGHQGFLRASDDDGVATAPGRLFSQAGGDAQLVQLDRLCRTLHALNYFPAAAATNSLFLCIDRRLLNFVSSDHGVYFEAILAKMGIVPGRVTIVMPAAAGDDPVTFVRAALSYRMRGYKVLAPLRSTAQADVSHIHLADPHYVAIDAALPRRREEITRIVAGLARRGIGTVARQIESEAQAHAARELGFGFLQGWHFAAPGERPSANLHATACG
jgi:EAL domain-containing protein (putative c-di-GMP-specific phosphodiesterase class I)